MKTVKSIMWGLVLIAVGVLMGLKAFDLIDFNIFFRGWWTFFIIVPCFIGLITDDDKIGSIIGLIVGVLLLLGARDILDYEVIGKLIVPIILVCIGLSLLFKNAFNAKINKAIKNINSTSKVKGEYNVIFSGQDVKVDNEEFNGTTINAIFGGIKLDLRNAIIKEDIVITGKAIFGGIDIYVPENVKVQVKSNSVFGGVDNKHNVENSEVTVYIDATCVFGGIDIK